MLDGVPGEFAARPMTSREKARQAATLRRCRAFGGAGGVARGRAAIAAQRGSWRVWRGPRFP